MGQDKLLINSLKTAFVFGQRRHSSVGLEQLICNQQVVGSNPTAGSFQVRIADLLICFLVDAQAHARDNKP